MSAETQNHTDIFSIIVKECKDHFGLSEEKVSGTAAVKYTKSSQSISSKDSDGEARTLVKAFRGESVGMEVEPCAEEKDTTAPCAEEKDTTSTRSLKSVKVKKLCQVGVEGGGASPISTEDLSTHWTLTSIKKDKKFKHRKHSLWYRLRRRHVHMGVVEVNSHHPFYNRLQAMSAGVQSIFENPNRLGPQENLLAEDYSAVIEKKLTMPGDSSETTFLFESYAPAVFATIRRAVSVEEDMYMESIISHQYPYLEFISNSRSGQDFFLSHNMRYLIKTNKEKDVGFLLSVLGEYLQHFLSYPHSLLVKYLGCYSIKLPGKKKIYFLVMQNIFFPANRIEDRFDVKGCTAGRYQQPDPPGSQTITVLKDQNFFQEELELGANSDWFIDQITADSSFLRDLNVMDYSLLIGRQKLHDSERKQHSLPDLITRIQKSAGKQASDSLRSSPPNAEQTMTGTPTQTCQDDLPGTVETHAQPEEDVSQQVKRGLQFPHSLALESFSNQRRRLLPDCPNALHIIDGPEYRYFFGIVDFLTQWTFRQKTARMWKGVKYFCGEHSTMPPNYYSQRFTRFISSRVT